MSRWNLIALALFTAAGCGDRGVPLDPPTDSSADDDDTANDDDSGDDDDATVDDDDATVDDDDSSDDDDATIDDDDATEPPGALCTDAGTEWAAVHAGANFTCGERPDGTRQCWGLDGNAEAQAPDEPFGGLSVGWSHACGIRPDASALCWGLNTDEQASPPAALFTQVSAGKQLSCGVQVGGALACWGAGVAEDNAPPGGTWSAVEVGDNIACALDGAGQVTCWGEDASDLLYLPTEPLSSLAVGGGFACGLGTGADVGLATCWSVAPSSSGLPDSAPAYSFTALDAGEDFVCGLRTDQRIHCWGHDPHGETHAPPGPFTAVSAGSHHACALRPSGALQCWGQSWQGSNEEPPDGGYVAALGGLASSMGPGATCLQRISGEWSCSAADWSAELPADLLDITAGGSHVCTLDAAGAIGCEGHGQEGQLDAPSGTFVQVRAAADLTCALSTAGEISCWGETVTGNHAPPPGPFESFALSNLIGCALDAAGTAICWGGTWPDLQPPEGEVFVDVAVGWAYACGLHADGTVLCWGNGAETWIGPDGTFESIAVSHVACGLDAAGSIQCWGDESLGDLPTFRGSEFDSLTSHGSTCAVGTDGSAECWVWYAAGPSGLLRVWAPAAEGAVNAAEDELPCPLLEAEPTLVFPAADGTVEFARIATVGDFDGDGLAEVVAGREGPDGGELVRAAAVLSGDESDDLQVLALDPLGSTGLGLTLAVGDVNGDDVDDLIIGYPTYNEDAMPGQGAVAVHLGGPTGPAPAAGWLLVGQEWQGVVLATGDLDADGRDEIIAGVDYTEATLQVIQGTDGPPPTAAAWTGEISGWTSYSQELQLVIGDFDGDGFGDLAVGMADSSNIDDVHVFAGSASLLPDEPSYELVVDEEATPFGSRLAAADLDGDGYDDLVAQASYDWNSTLLSNAGRLQWFRGGPAGLESIAAWDEMGSTETGGLGRTLLSHTDVDGDGFDDIVAEAGGSVGSSLLPRVQPQFHVWLGGPGGPAQYPDASVRGSDHVGWSQYLSWEAPRLLPAAGDVDGDGLPDLLVAESAHSSGASLGGLVRVHRACPGGCP